MTAGLGALLEVAPPPDQPCNPGFTEGWSGAESHFGLSFPVDYKGLIGHYGSGIWGGRLLVLNPFSVNRYINPRMIIENSHLWLPEEPKPPSIHPWFLERWAHFRQEARIRRQASPYPFFPERPGLFPWAYSRQEEHCLYWLTRGDPDRWPVVIESRREIPHFSRPIESGCSELLRRWLRGELHRDDLPSPIVDDQGSWFVPQFPRGLFLSTYSWAAQVIDEQ